MELGLEFCWLNYTYCDLTVGTIFSVSFLLAVEIVLGHMDCHSRRILQQVLHLFMHLELSLFDVHALLTSGGKCDHLLRCASICSLVKV